MLEGLPQRGVGGIEQYQIAGFEELKRIDPRREGRRRPGDRAIGESERESGRREGEGGVGGDGGVRVCGPDERVGRGVDEVEVVAGLLLGRAVEGEGEGGVWGVQEDARAVDEVEGGEG